MFKLLPNDSGIKIRGWTITSKKGTIGNSNELKGWAEFTRLPTNPDMCFGTNEFRLEHDSNGFFLSFNTLDALSMVDHTKGPDNIKVSTAEKWAEGSKQQLSRLEKDEKILEVLPSKEFDWTYTTLYKGTVKSQWKIEPTTEPINIALLQQPDPILYFDENTLFEDEMADNGVASLVIKARVMNNCLLVLLRYFLRVDGVLFRIYDTRIFHEFHKDYLIREFQQKEGEYHAVCSQLEEGAEKSSVTDSNAIDKLLTKKSSVLDKIIFK